MGSKMVSSVLPLLVLLLAMATDVAAGGRLLNQRRERRLQRRERLLDAAQNVSDYEMTVDGLSDEPIGLLQYRQSVRRSIFEDRIVFRFYNSGNLTKQTTFNSSVDMLNGTDCPSDGQFAFIVHGWRENCYEVPWVLDLRENLREHRGGCIVCMDYSAFSSGSYGSLVSKFRDIRDILLRVLTKLRYEGVSYDKLYMFGFSFGAQLVLDVGSLIGTNEIESIDTCDMAGPGFDSDRIFRQADFRNAAKNVQCIHTSLDKGTKMPNKCHQNWKMGLCGAKQLAAGPPPLGSHGLCPVFYNLAFKYDFFAEPRPLECILSGEAAEYPHHYKMGYMENRKSDVRGELYARTSDVYPYTVFNNPYNFFDYF